MVVYQQYRTVRLGLVLGIVVLTVFLYISYYTSPIEPLYAKQQHHLASSVAGETLPQNAAALVSGVGYDNFTSGAGNKSLDKIPVTSVRNESKIEVAGPPSADDAMDSGVARQPADQDAHQPSSSSYYSPPVVATGSQNSFKDGERQEARMSAPLLRLTAPGVSAVENTPPKTSASSANEVKVNMTVSVHVHLDPAQGIRTSELYESGHSEPNPELCPAMGESIRLLILVTSAPTHYDARMAIRHTWGHYGMRRDTAVAFFLGATSDPGTEEQLASENALFGDLIQGRFVDSYNNLTLKTISILEWVDTYCPQAAFVLKTDDDMFINVPKLMQFMDKHSNERRHIYGRLAKKWKPIRNKKSKYYVSPNQYLPKYFPDFTTGPAYLMTADVIHDLYEKSLGQTYLKLEDVFTTGIVAQLAKVKRVHVTEFLNRRIAFNACNIKKAISVHMVKGQEQYDLWKKLMDTNLKCK
ncbi:beta-1,3-galactosyltransferase 5-like [Phlebotomus argentipes]|uniref:beta-1,3-galactosyltransferase 5-like n=1 Tax=Phlebotomus argentipes TaxID=94469 RepID=UPI002892A199|nr:beta-1,3-galactosyltransferase 5-like [Phlebotomus argentipes]XP_059614036.1 beta-1,3-galactosyltransferase 5-like [Phlebotomus argentipes]XP_059614037.1 beta-1,3-galactosyltransferase 5-like [Phlebotomus argentipes]